ncbi:MAG: glycosyltransferase family 4 protein [Aquabacterium sp.]
MNILLLNHYAGTPQLGMEYRPYYLAREWVRLGHRVTIVAGGFSHVRAQQPALGTLPQDEWIDGIQYRWLPLPRYQGNGIGRVRNIAQFLWPLWHQAEALAAEFRPDAVIASSTYPMDIWPARRIARAASALLVHEVHDLWPLTPIELGQMSPRHPFIRLCQAAEDAACRDADRVVSMLPKVHDYLAAHGLDLDKLHIVPNGIVPEDWPASAAEAPLRADVAQALERQGDETLVGYAGSMGTPNALDTLLDAAAQTRGQALRFVLVGSGMERERLARRITDENLSHVRLLEPIPKAQIPAFLARLDIAYIGWQRVSLYRFGIAPNKLMDYMMAGCTVLHSVEAGNDPVTQAGCGLTVPPQDPRAVALGLRQLASLTPQQRREMGRRGSAYVQAHHAYPVLAARFIEALQR